MEPIRSIVAATDLSVPAKHAAERAAKLAQSSRAQLTLLHAIDGSVFDDLRRWLGSADDGAERAVVDDATQRLRRLAADMAQRHQLAVAERIGTGRAVDQISGLAQELDADLIVTGRLGAGFTRHLVGGSTAERVVKRSRRPVLLVRQTPHVPYERVLVPVDFSAWSQPAIELALRVAPKAHLVLMHAIDVPLEGRMRLVGVDHGVIERYRQAAWAEARDKLVDLASRAGLDRDNWTMAISLGSDPWMAIVQQEQEQDCELTVIGKHGRSALEEFMLGSVTRMVIAESVGDVLIAARSET